MLTFRRKLKPLALSIATLTITLLFMPSRPTAAQAPTPLSALISSPLLATGTPAVRLVTECTEELRRALEPSRNECGETRERCEKIAAARRQLLRQQGRQDFETTYKADFMKCEDNYYHCHEVLDKLGCR